MARRIKYSVWTVPIVARPPGEPQFDYVYQQVDRYTASQAFESLMSCLEVGPTDDGIPGPSFKEVHMAAVPQP